MTERRQRRVARVLLFDERGSVLLFHEPRRRDRGGWWYTPGGEIETGEAAEAAARRELSEETGIEPARLAGPVLLRRIRFLFNDEEIDQDEVFFAAWVEGSSIVAARTGDLEFAAIAGHRWWSAAELSASDETIFPPDLGALVEGVLRDGVPIEP